MKNQKLLYLISIMCLFYSSDIKLYAHWDTLSTGTNSNLYAVQFVNSNTGWIIGSGGIIKKSVDGGNSWSSQNSNTLQSLRRIIMIDANTGFTCGDSGKILKTSNGGTNWNNTNTTGSIVNIFAMDFINASTGFCAGESRTQFKTTNGGTNWTSSAMSGVGSGVNVLGLELIDANKIFVCTNAGGFPLGGKIYKSVNSGSSYSLVFSDVITFGFDNLNDIKFKDANTGIAGSSNGKYVITINGGSSWDTHSSDRGINQINFTDLQNGFMCGDDLSKSYSSDGGINWTLDYNNSETRNLHGISFIDSRTGWMSGTDGLLIKTINGGVLPSSCSINNSSWVEINGEVSNCLDIEIDSCGNVYTTGFVRNSSDTNILFQKFNSSGYLYWSKSYGASNGADVGKVIKLDNEGNIFIAGYRTSSGSDKDIILLKYKPNGILEKTSFFDTLSLDQEAVDMTIDTSGNILIAGKSNLNAFYSNFDYQTLKFNNSGTLEWSRKYGSFDEDDIPVAIVSNNSGNVFISGTSFDFLLNGYGITTVKYSNTGNVLWIREGGFTGSAADMTIGGNGNIYITGSAGPEGLNNSRNLVTMKYTSSGTLSWQEFHDGGLSVNDIPSSIVNQGGRVVITGYTWDILNSEFEFLTVKYNSDGDLQWSERYSKPLYQYLHANDLVIDNSGNVFITGDCVDSIGSGNIATLKYDPLGNLQHANFYNSDGYGNYGNKVGVDNLGNIFVGGRSSMSNYKSTVIKYKPDDFSGCILNLTALMQGFYNASTNVQIGDTVRILLREASSPYSVADSLLTVSDSSGSSASAFTNASNINPYYIVIKHRNSIETWSGLAQNFSTGVLNYDFTSSVSQAYGSNMIQVDNSPNKFAIYSGDVNQDGTVDATDLSSIDNDASNFVSGYVVTDLTGDNFVDGTDFAIADNNAANFVSVIRP